MSETLLASQLEAGAAGIPGRETWATAHIPQGSPTAWGSPAQRSVARDPAFGDSVSQLVCSPSGSGREECHSQGISGGPSTAEILSVCFRFRGYEGYCWGTHRATAIVKGLVSSWSGPWDVLTMTKPYNERRFDISTIDKNQRHLASVFVIVIVLCGFVTRPGEGNYRTL